MRLTSLPKLVRSAELDPGVPRFSVRLDGQRPSIADKYQRIPVVYTDKLVEEDTIKFYRLRHREIENETKKVAPPTLNLLIRSFSYCTCHCYHTVDY